MRTPRPGIYTYDVVESRSGEASKRYPQEATIDPPRRREDGVWVELRYTHEGTEEISAEVHVYRDAGIDIVFADGCALDRPATLYVFPLAIGREWPSPRSCEGTSDTATTRVMARETMTVRSERVEAFKISRTASLGGNRSVRTQWYSTRHSIVVRSEFEETIDGETHTVTQTLRSLMPA